MELILFTTNFPLGSSEQFLECEILYLSRNFERITIIPLTDSGKPQPRSLPSNAAWLPPLISFPITFKIRLFFQALLNMAPVKPFLADFFKNKVFLKRSRFMHWLSACSVARAALASTPYKKIKEIVTSTTIFYFYWGDKSSALVPFLKNQFPGNKYIARFHGTDLYETKTPGYMPLRKELLRNLDLIVLISAHGQKYLVERFPEFSSKVRLSRLGVLSGGESRPSSDGILRIVTCSNLVKIKRLHLLMEALKLIDFPVEWTIIGDGELSDKLKEQAKGLVSPIHVTFLGALMNEEVMQFYRKFPVDILINVSAHEGLPVSIMEAISFGVPVIAPRVGGIPEIVNEGYGYLLPANPTAKEIAAAISRFYHLEEETKEKMRKAAKQFWKVNFNADVNYQEFSEMIKSS